MAPELEANAGYRVVSRSGEYLVEYFRDGRPASPEAPCWHAHFETEACNPGDLGGDGFSIGLARGRDEAGGPSPPLYPVEGFEVRCLGRPEAA